MSDAYHKVTIFESVITLSDLQIFVQTFHLSKGNYI